MKTLHIVPHTHWDREWYFTSEESQVLLYQHMKDLLAFMEEHPQYPFYVLDGQTVLLEDYLEAAPQDRSRIADLVRQGRLIIGPWYTQTDEMAVGGESIARNLYWGGRDCRSFQDAAGEDGSCNASLDHSPRMAVGYLPDSFGQCAQMPMLLRQAGIPYSVFWRGTSSRHGVGSEFTWESEDGSRVTVQQLPLCYALGRFLPTDESLRKRMDMTLAALERFATPGCTDFVLPAGFDQMPVQKDMDQVIALLREWYPDWNFVLDSYENVCRLQESRSDLPTIRGEFLDGSTARVHRSIYSTRMDLKIKNTRLEQYITHVAEPLSAMAWQLGLSYPAGLYEKLWKELMKNHAHDSMGCCCSDEVHRVIDSRYEDVRLRAEMLVKYAMRFIADHQETPPAIVQLMQEASAAAAGSAVASVSAGSASTGPDSASPAAAQAALVGRTQASGEEKLLLFNTLPVERRLTVTAQVTTRHAHFILRDAEGNPVSYQLLDQAPVDASIVFRELKRRSAEGDLDPFTRYTIAIERQLPAFGYETLYLDFAGNGRSCGPKEVPADMVNASPSESLQIEDSFYRVCLLEDGSLDILDKRDGRLYHGLARWEDSGNAGDEYDYSPPEKDQVLTEVRLLSGHAENGPLISRLHYSLSMSVYRNLSVRSGAASGQTAPEDMIPLGLSCTLSLQNDGLIRFLTEVQNDADDHRLRLLFPTGISAEYSHASQAFGEILRPVNDPCLAVWEKEKWEERPDGIYPMLDYVYLQDNARSFGLITGGGREYEITGSDQDTIAFTVLSCTGMCGEDDLIRRPGRLSGIALPTPDSQMHGTIRQEFALALSAPGGCASASQLYHWPAVCWHQAERQEFFLNKKDVRTPVRASLLKLNGNVQISAVKKAEEEDALLVRVFNPSESAQEFSICPGACKEGNPSVIRADLLEQPVTPDQTAAGSTGQEACGSSDTGSVQELLRPNQMQSYLVSASPVQPVR